jgi:ABC-2 type transport system permease protein
MVVDNAGRKSKLPMKDWMEIGVSAPTEERKEVGKLHYLQKRLDVNDRPAKVGVDPHQLLIDWKVEDNYKVVKSKN